MVAMGRFLTGTLVKVMFVVSIGTALEEIKVKLLHIWSLGILGLFSLVAVLVEIWVKLIHICSQGGIS